MKSERSEATSAEKAFKIREGLIFFGFLLLLIVGVLTVVLPEIMEEPPHQKTSDTAQQTAEKP